MAKHFHIRRRGTNSCGPFTQFLFSCLPSFALFISFPLLYCVPFFFLFFRPSPLFFLPCSSSPLSVLPPSIAVPLIFFLLFHPSPLFFLPRSRIVHLFYLLFFRPSPHLFLPSAVLHHLFLFSPPSRPVPLLLLHILFSFLFSHLSRVTIEC